MKSNKPEPPSNDHSTWMVAYITYDLMDGHIVVGRLRHEGIMAIVDHLAGRGALGLTIGTWGEVRVLVHPADYEAAQLILAEDEPDSQDELDDGNTIYMDNSEEDGDDEQYDHGD